MHEQSALEIVSGWGPAQFVVVVFSTICTAWLLGLRIRAWLKVTSPIPARDLALLAASPVCAMLFSIVRIAGATATYLRGGLDVEYALLYGLPDAALICEIAFFCFVIGVVAVNLPTKSSKNKA